MAQYETKGTGTGPKSEFTIKDMEEFCRRMRNAGASGNEIVKAKVRFSASISELRTVIETNPLHKPYSVLPEQRIGELTVPAEKIHGVSIPKQRHGDSVWACPKPGCLFRATGDMDSPYDADLCPEHNEPIVRLDKLK